MKVICGKSALEKETFPSSTLTVGTFDGVHKGHVVLLKRLIEAARELDTVSVVVTFDPHPQMVLGSRGPTEILNTTEEKLERLEMINPDVTVILEFNRQLASLEAETFLKRILKGLLNMKHFVMGYDHSFGKDRKGNFELVSALSDSHGYTCEMVGPVLDGGAPIKSSRIRRELKSGDYASAVDMLAYNYYLTGEVIRGTGIGVKLGYPTINLNIPPVKLLPKQGVYAARIHVEGKAIPGMAYVGGRLTFGDETIAVEANLFDFNGDLSGCKVRLVLERYTRPPRKFETPEQLIAALAEDEREVKKILHI